MRSSKSRSRNKSNRQRSMGNIVNRVFDSSGPEGKVRGTPQQIIDKYLALARDAQLGNDRVAEQNFLQHAEHYTRMLGEAQREQAREQEARNQQRQQNQQNGNGHQNGNGQGGQPEAAAPRADDEQPRPAEPPQSDTSGSMMPPMPDPEEDSSALVETPESRAEDSPAPEAKPSRRSSRSRSAKSAGSSETSETADAAEKPKRTRRSRSKPAPTEDGGDTGDAAQPAASEASPD